jgi:hypothetical protein
MPRPVGGDECSDFKNPIGRTFLCGNRIFAEAGKSRLSVKPRPVGGVLHCYVYTFNKFFKMGEINLVLKIVNDRLKSIRQAKFSGELRKGV